MGPDPFLRFLDNQRRRLADHHFDGFQAEHHIEPATGQVNMGWRMILLAQLNAVRITKSILVDVPRTISPKWR